MHDRHGVAVKADDACGIEVGRSRRRGMCDPKPQTYHFCRLTCLCVWPACRSCQSTYIYLDIHRTVLSNIVVAYNDIYRSIHQVLMARINDCIDIQSTFMTSYRAQTMLSRIDYSGTIRLIRQGFKITAILCCRINIYIVSSTEALATIET